MRSSKPLTDFVEDELAMGLLVSDAVKALLRWPVAELTVAGNAPSLDRLGLGCR